MIVDRGHDWPDDIQRQLNAYGKDMWLFRDDKSRATTRARNTYRNDSRGYTSCVVRSICMAYHGRSFQYLNSRVRLTPRDLYETKLECPATLHFICSPSRAKVIISEVAEYAGWSPITIYEPIPVCDTFLLRYAYSCHIFENQDRCVPEELPALLEILPEISILRFGACS